MIILLLTVRYLYRLGKEKVPTAMIVLAGLISAATLPYVWFIFPVVFSENYMVYVVSSEIIVFIVEAIFYYFFLKIDWKQSFISSFLCNLASYLFGIYVLNNIFLGGL